MLSVQALAQLSPECDIRLESYASFILEKSIGAHSRLEVGKVVVK